MATTTSPPLAPPSAQRRGSELEKFKRRMIRAVARRTMENKTTDIWEDMRKEVGKNCQKLWERMRQLTLKKLKRLLEADDRVDLIGPVARMTITDWLLFDLVIVHEKIDVIERDKLNGSYHSKVLDNLFSLVQRFEIEGRSGDDLAEAWAAATVYYNSKGHQCSPMMLQRRWYQIKELTRHKFYKFWFNYRGNSRQLDQAKQDPPDELQKAIALKYPGVVTSVFPDWQERIEQRLVILPDEFAPKMRQKNLMKPSDVSAPDVVLIEPRIEVIDLGTNSDSDEEVPSLPASETQAPPLVKIKNEPIDIDENFEIEETFTLPPEKGSEFDEEIERLQMVEERIFNDDDQDSRDVDTDAQNFEAEDKDEDANSKDVENTTQSIINDTNTEVNNAVEIDDHVESPKTASVDKEPDEVEIVRNEIDEALEESHVIAEIASVASAGVKVENVNDVIEQDGMTDQAQTDEVTELLPIISTVSSAGVKVEKELAICDDMSREDNSMAVDSDITPIDKYITSVEEPDDTVNLGKSCTIDEVSAAIMAISNTNTTAMETEHIDNETLHTDPPQCEIEPSTSQYGVQNVSADSDIIPTEDDDDMEVVKNTEADKASADGINLDTYGHVPTNLTFADDGIQFADDGIAFVDDDEDDIITIRDPPKELKKEESGDDGKESDSNEDNEDAIQTEAQKFDLKLLMCPVVYTTKLEAMALFQDHSMYEQVYHKESIDKIFSLSKPISKRAVNNIEQVDRSDDEIIVKIEKDEPTPHYDNAVNVSDDDLFNNNDNNNSYSDSDLEVDDSQRVKLSSYLLQKPKNRSYNPFSLCKNPDFNTRLKRLSVGFLMLPRNRSLLQRCIPTTVDLSKAFENKLVNGTLYIKKTPTDSVINIPDVDVTSSSLVKPSAVPVQSLMTIDDTLENELKKCMAERNRAINLPDISQVRRLNQHLLTAEVTPLRLQNEVAEQSIKIENASKTNNYVQNIKNDIDNLLCQQKSIGVQNTTDTVLVDPVNTVSIPSPVIYISNTSAEELGGIATSKVEQTATTSVTQPIVATVNRPLTANVNQSIATMVNQPITPRVSQSIATRVNQPITPSVSQSIATRVNQPITPSVSQSIATRVNQPITPSVSQTIATRVNQPITPRVSQSIATRVNQPITPSVSQSIALSNKPDKPKKIFRKTYYPPVSWTSKERYAREPSQGDSLLTIDTLYKMLNALGQTDTYLKQYEKKKTKKKIDKIEINKPNEAESKEDKSKEDRSIEDKSKEDKSKEDISKEDKSKEDKSKEGKPAEGTDLQNSVIIDITDDDVKPVKKKAKCKVNVVRRNEYCCWARYKIEFLRHTIRSKRKHRCYPDSCVCCCKEELEQEEKTVLIHKPVYDKVTHFHNFITHQDCKSSEELARTENISQTIEHVVQSTLTPKTTSDFSSQINLDANESSNDMPVSEINDAVATIDGSMAEGPIRVKPLVTLKSPEKIQFRVLSESGNNAKTVNESFSEFNIEVKPYKPRPRVRKPREVIIEPVQSQINKSKAPQLVEPCTCRAKITSINRGRIEINGSKTCLQHKKVVKESKVFINKRLARNEIQPFFVGRGKILLTNMKMPKDNDEPKPISPVIEPVPTPEPPAESVVVPTLCLPDGVHIVILADQTITYIKQAGTSLTPEEYAALPHILIALQQQLNAVGITLPADHPVSTTDEIIDLDKDDTTDKNRTNTETNNTEVPEPIETSTSIPKINTEDSTLKENISQINEYNTSVTKSTPVVRATAKDNSSKNQNSQSPNSDMSVENFEESDVSKTSATDKEEKIPAEGKEPESDGGNSGSRKSLLSDLMEMSGIFEEDASAAMASPAEVPAINPILNQTCAQQHDGLLPGSMPLLQSIPEPGLSAHPTPKLAPLSDELSAVTSFAELKYASDNGGQFFKLDLESGKLTSINVCIQKFQNTPSKLKTTEKTVIDLTDEPDIEITNETEEENSNSPPKMPPLQKLTKIAPAGLVTHSQVANVLNMKQKLMDRLSNNLKPVNILQSKRHVARILKRNRSLIRDPQFSFYSKRKIDRIEVKIDLVESDTPMEEEYLVSDGDSSDDEPLINKAKRMRAEEAGMSGPSVTDQEVHASQSNKDPIDKQQDNTYHKHPVQIEKKAPNTGENENFDGLSVQFDENKNTEESWNEQAESNESMEVETVDTQRLDDDMDIEEMIETSAPILTASKSLPVPTNLVLSGDAFNMHNIPLNQTLTRNTDDESSQEDCILGV